VNLLAFGEKMNQLSQLQPSAVASEQGLCMGKVSSSSNISQRKALAYREEGLTRPPGAMSAFMYAGMLPMRLFRRTLTCEEDHPVKERVRVLVGRPTAELEHVL